MDTLLLTMRSGAGNLAAYLAAHVLLCLLPAFAIAGAMTALIPKSAITRWLGRGTPAPVSYPAAAAAGSLLAVCSCTIVPLFAGIHRKGAGIGPAVTFLFFAPAGNVLALTYTGGILGPEFALARLVLCAVFGIGIGLAMATLFAADDARHDARTDALFGGSDRLPPGAPGLLLSLVAVLLAGTLKLAPLAVPLAAVELPLPAAADWQATLLRWVPFDAARGEEGVSVQGALLIALLLALGVAARLGLEDIGEGANRWTGPALGLAITTLLLAALRLTPRATGLELALTGRTLAVAAALASAAAFAHRLNAADTAAWRAWLWESWRFVRQIFGLLVAGVFVVGAIRPWVQPEWVQALAGRNDLAANAAAVAFGVVMYFPTLVEVPVARLFLDLGMHPGPLLAYLMADPELSLQSLLMVAAVIGRRQAMAYVALVALFSMAAGWIYGAWVDGAVVAWAGGLAAVALAAAAAAGWAGLRAWRARHPQSA